MQGFAAKQVWSYQTRSGEEASRIVICRVESDQRLGAIVHIHVNGLRFLNSRFPGGSSDHIGHLPYASAELKKCLTKLEGTVAELPDFNDGYQKWLAEFLKGQAGIWTIPVAEAIGTLEEALNK